MHLYAANQGWKNICKCQIIRLHNIIFFSKYISQSVSEQYIPLINLWLLQKFAKLCNSDTIPASHRCATTR